MISVRYIPVTFKSVCKIFIESFLCKAIIHKISHIIQLFPLLPMPYYYAFLHLFTWRQSFVVDHESCFSSIQPAAYWCAKAASVLSLTSMGSDRNQQPKIKRRRTTTRMAESPLHQHCKNSPGRSWLFFMFQAFLFHTHTLGRVKFSALVCLWFSRHGSACMASLPPGRQYFRSQRLALQAVCPFTAL